MESPNPLTYSVQGAAETLGIGKTKLYEEIGAGRLRSITCGTRRLVTRRALEEYVAMLELGDGHLSAAPASLNRLDEYQGHD